ncbi:uncharacterized protein [Onthophagus taurus]|uniref:uncharacterized protein isoform X2 n=1 Tax=Onthophagus taurus TaxID=166361 RepID=UPI000C2042FA|nr:uncharacterized protein LOC111426945 isoform X2 [Onthophagus taurus]
MRNNLLYATVYISLIFVLHNTASAVKINSLQVPEAIRLGFPVVLDCDYTIEEEAADGLVVKWYFNKTQVPIYQWIPTRRPQDFGILKGRLNLEYSASKDINSVHRALHIMKPGLDLSGEYTCSVSTFNGEDVKSKKMLVYAPQKNIELKQTLIDETVQVSCIAEGVYPAPNMTLLAGNSLVNDSVVTVQERGGLYNIKASGNVSVLDAPEEFSCELHIPQANYSVRIEAVYYPQNGAAQLKSTTVLFLWEFMLLAAYVMRLSFEGARFL